VHLEPMAAEARPSEAAPPQLASRSVRTLPR
jgi:hypothetical protein